MKPKIVYLKLKELKPHELTSAFKVRQLIKSINGRSLFTTPIVVERRSNIILDGHHRVAALKKLGYQKVPAIIVSYGSAEVKVYLRHNNLPMSLVKELIIKTARAGIILPAKTTRHYLTAGRVRNLKCNLKKLRQ